MHGNFGHEQYTNPRMFIRNVSKSSRVEVMNFELYECKTNNSLYLIDLLQVQL